MSSSLQPPHRRLSNRLVPVLVVVSVLLGMLALPGIAPHAGADPVAVPTSASVPTIVGAACAPNTGVTVVVDFRELNDVIELGCAPGPQASGIAALTSAGFGVNVGVTPYPGTVCTLDGLPTQGYPYCWTTGGLWSYWTSNGSDPWAFSPNGAASSGALPVGSVQGWSWNLGFSTQATAPRLAATDLATASASARALGWLEAQLEANGWTFDGQTPGVTDWGITIDAVLALAAAGRSDSPAVAAVMAQVSANVTPYVTWAPQHPDVRVAGAFAKELLVATVQGATVTDFGGWDLDAELRALMVADGTWSGRFADHNPTFPTADESNGFSQALAILGLARTAGGVPESATQFLLAQQCPGGGFRLSYLTTRACTSSADADADATALATQALLVVDRTQAVKVALDGATRWMLDLQEPATGAFRGTGLLPEPNTNGTGLMAQAVRAVGQTGAADRAATWITSLQLTEANGGSAAARLDAGAIAPNPGLFEPLTTPDTTGIPDNQRQLWHRSTSQAVLGLGLVDYGSINLSTAKEFSDVGFLNTFYDDIRWMVLGGITTGYTDGTFRPTIDVSRQGAATFLFRYFADPGFVAPQTPSFGDVPTTHLFYREIEWMKAEGLTTGNVDGTFAPGAVVTRQSFAAFLHRLAGSPPPPPGAPTFSDVGPGHTFAGAISWLASTQVTTGYPDGTFRPTSAVTRQTTAAFLHRYALLP